MIHFNFLQFCRLSLLFVALYSPAVFSLETKDGCDLDNDGQVSGVKELLCEKERENIEKQKKIMAIEKALAEAEQRLQQLNEEIAQTEQKDSAAVSTQTTEPSRTAPSK